MTRAELIEKVKIKLEEVSPFDEPTSFIAAAGDSDYEQVKPVKSYIDGTLDEAASFCLATLPSILLNQDVQSINNATIFVDNKGVGRLLIDSKDRCICVELPIWERPCRTIITTDSPLYVLQQNRYTRGGTAKPVVSYNQTNGAQLLELYSYPSQYNGTQQNGKIDYIATDTKAEDIQSDIVDFIVLRCALLVYNIFGNAQQIEILNAEWEQKLTPYLP